jgi:DNA-binding GntR family transcriptional regulator
MLREKILAGELAPGERITETRMSRELKAGQPSVREALFILERQGMVQRFPNLGTFVTELDIRDISNLYQIRSVLECLAIELAAQKIHPQALAEVRVLAENMRRAAAKEGKRGYFEADLAFHRKIWELAGNRQLAELLENTVVPLFAFSFLRIDRTTAELAESAKAHEEIVEALARGPREAQEVLRTKIRLFLERYLSHALNHVLPPLAAQSRK